MRPVRPQVNRKLVIGTGLLALASLVVTGCQSGAEDVTRPAASFSPSPPTATSGSPTASVTASPSTSLSPTAPPVPPTQTPAPSGTTAAPAGQKQLPRGGTMLFPHYRLVGYSGGAAKSFGRLGIGDLQGRMDEIEKLGKKYATDGREPQPVMELITTVVQASPGKDGKYRTRMSDAEIARYLQVARRNKALLLLNIQPGRADFLTEVQALSRWLAEPDVGVALDPEWAVGPGQRPGHVFGHTSAAELNQVSLWLSQFVAQHQLPQKAFVVHQLASRIISDVPGLRVRGNLAFVLSVDGIGSRKAKEETWRKLVKPLPAGVHAGFKLFFEEDREHGALMTPPQVLRLRPRPEYVLYE